MSTHVGILLGESCVFEDELVASPSERRSFVNSETDRDDIGIELEGIDKLGNLSIYAYIGVYI
jgi:hypothetical protein